MLVSHRWHSPPIDGVRLELDRVVCPTWVFRRARVCGLTQDERLTTKSLGRGAPVGRSRLVVSLGGRAVLFAHGREIEIGRGGAVVVSDLGEVDVRAEEGLAFEIDWEPSSWLASEPCPAFCHVLLDPRTVAAMDALSTEVRGASTQTQWRVARAGKSVLAALRSEGLPLRLEGLDEGSCAPEEEETQRLIMAFDAELCSLEGGPALVTIEDRLGWSRRTVARRAREAHARYGVSAMSGADWRSARDFYRLLLGTILSSHPSATTGKVASMLGYSSPAALCHAFAHAGLPSPSVVGERTRAG